MMLKPDKDRLNYSELLKPPAGYEVEYAVGTTYSLDLEALIGIPLALGLSEDMDQTLKSEPIYILEALRRTTDKFAVFCEAAQIQVPVDGNSIFALLEDSVFEIALENERSFHPKIWIVKYHNEAEKELYRVLVMTRNLTFDRSWDIALALEGEKREEVNEKSQALNDFLSFLLKFSTNDKHTAQIEQLMSELSYVHFEPGKHFPDYEFLPIGISGYGKENVEIFDSYDQIITMSPFVSESILRELISHKKTDKENVLITRRAELPKLNQTILDNFSVYVLKEMIIEGEETISEGDEMEEAAKLQDIHAKLYAKSRYNRHHFYIGSANSSHYAFNGNVEFLLKLRYKKYGFRITDLLEDIFGAEEEDNPFERIMELPKQEEREVDISEELQKVIKKLCRIDSKASIEENAQGFSLAINFEQVTDDVKLSIGPLLSKQYKQMETHTVFEGLGITELGEFYRIIAEKDGIEVQRIIKIDTSGIPEERNSEIYKSNIKNQDAFMKYVAFLLADDFLLATLEQFDNKQTAFGSWNMTETEDPILYENMLRAASRNPEKLYDVERVVEIIDDQKLIPEDFDKLYQTFKRADKSRWKK